MVLGKQMGWTLPVPAMKVVQHEIVWNIIYLIVVLLKVLGTGWRTRLKISFLKSEWE